MVVCIEHSIAFTHHLTITDYFRGKKEAFQTGERQRDGKPGRDMSVFLVCVCARAQPTCVQLFSVVVLEQVLMGKHSLSVLYGHGCVSRFYSNTVFKNVNVTVKIFLFRININRKCKWQENVNVVFTLSHTGWILNGTLFPIPEAYGS